MKNQTKKSIESGTIYNPLRNKSVSRSEMTDKLLKLSWSRRVV